jgi:hypothetical protein
MLSDVAGRHDHSIEGRVERVHGGVIQGWAWDAAQPDRRLELRVSLNGHEVGATVAELPRPSLADAGIGDGEYAFRFALPVTLARTGPHRLRVDAGGAELPAATSFATDSNGEEDPWFGATFTIEGPAPSGRLDQGTGPAAVDGRVDQIRNGVIEGWAWDASEPDTRLEVAARLDDELLGTVVADLPRGSLAVAGIGDGRHGFRFELPPAHAAPGARQLRVTALGVPLQPSSAFAVVASEDDPWTGAAFTLLPVASEPVVLPPSAVLLGREGWLFDPQLALASREPAAARRERALIRVAAAVSRASEAGIKLLLALLPSKADVYPAELPAVVAQAPRERVGDGLVDAMLADPVLDPIDLMASLAAGAGRHDVFHPIRDGLSHWGSFCAYRPIVKRLATAIPGVPRPLALAAVEVATVPGPDHREPVLLATEVGLIDCPAERVPPTRAMTVLGGPAGAGLAISRNALDEIGPSLVAGWEQPGREDLASLLILGSPEFEGVADWCARHFRRTLLADSTEQIPDLAAYGQLDAVLFVLDEGRLD